MNAISRTLLGTTLLAAMASGAAGAVTPGDDYSDLFRVLPAIHAAADGPITTWSNPDTGHWGLVEMAPAAGRVGVGDCRAHGRRWECDGVAA